MVLQFWQFQRRHVGKKFISLLTCFVYLALCSSPSYQWAVLVIVQS